MSFPLSVPPTPAHEKRSEALLDVVQQIFDERGHLRHVTERLLEAEFEVNGNQDGDSLESEGEDEKLPDLETKRKELHEARMEMLQLVGQANNEALTLLDFVSLLLSKDSPQQGQSSMSPALKTMAPSGTLGFDKNHTLKISEVDEETNKTIAMGFNFKSLNSAADKIFRSAVRLEDEIRKETNYWEHILSVSEAGWTLCRIPGQEHAVGVRFGFSEAPPQFQGRGLAALRPSGTGELILDRGAGEENKSIRVRIVHDGQVIDETQTSFSEAVYEEPLEVRILKARDSLFDEELFHELTREARILYSCGVTVKAGVISIPLQAQSRTSDVNTNRQRREMLIDLIPRSRLLNGTNQYSESFALALRLSLTFAHRQKYRQRSEPPPPLSLEKRQSPTISLIHPMLNHFEHHDRVEGLRESIYRLTETLRSAQLDSTFAVNHLLELSPRRLEKRAATSSLSNLPSKPMEAIVSSLQGPLSSSFTLSVPSSMELSIQVSTQLSNNVYGTSFELTSANETDAEKTTPLIFSHHIDLVNQIEHIVSKSVARYISTKFSGWTLEASGKDLTTSATGKSKKISVRTSNGRLGLLLQLEGPIAKPAVIGAWDWNRAGGKKSLEEVVEQVKSISY